MKITGNTPGQLVKNLREHLDLTQRDFAELTGIKQPQIARIENDKNVTGYPILSRIARACDMEFQMSFVENPRIAAYREWVNSLGIGDTVFPAYDGKVRRVTECRVTNVDDEFIYVTGFFWGETEIEVEGKFYRGEVPYEILGTASIVYDEEPTLMQMLGADEDGDFYRLVQPTTPDQD